MEESLPGTTTEGMHNAAPVQYLDNPPVGTAADPVYYDTLTGNPAPAHGMYAESVDTPGMVGTISNFTLMELVQMFVVYAFIIAAALAAIFIFVGGISFILSGGNDDKIRQAVNTIRYAIVGLIVTILSFTFVAIVGRIFGLNFLDYLSYDQIKDSINRLVQRAEVSDRGGFTPYTYPSGSTTTPPPITPDMGNSRGETVEPTDGSRTPSSSPTPGSATSDDRIIPAIAE